MRQLPCVFLACLLLLLRSAAGVRIYKDRDALMNILSADKSGEERVFMEICLQSSGTGNCMLAIDDDIIHEWTQCASTEREEVGWWRAQLETPAYVTRVVIHTVEMPEAEMQSALTDFALLASDITCYRHVSTEKFTTKSFPCDALADQIMVQSFRANAVLSLCEIEVYGKPLKFQGMESGEMEIDMTNCVQSSTHTVNRCEFALDRNFVQTPGAYGKVCAQTQVEADDQTAPWWTAQFTLPTMVKHVKFFARTDCCSEDYFNFIIKVNEAVCARHAENTPLVVQIFKCERFGSYVKVESRLPKTKFTICQLQVFGHKLAILSDTVYTYLGCYNDRPEEPDLELHVSSTFMAPKKCHKMCKRLNKKYFGLQNGHLCMCGNKYGRHGQADKATGCTMPCHSDSLAICGGINENSVYEILM